MRSLSSTQPLLLLLLLLRWTSSSAHGLADRYGLFCGMKSDCYDDLGVAPTSTKREIQKEYRRLSLEYHPDKNKEEGTEKIFRAVAQAYEILSVDDRRESLDYYLAHPKEYWKAYGDFVVYTYAEASDWKLVVFMLLLAFSVAQPLFLMARHHQQVEFLKKAAVQNLGIGQGGTKQTLEIRRRAMELLQSGASSSSSKKSNRVSQDALQKKVEELLADVQIEGTYRKPTHWDIPIVSLAMLPVKWYKYVSGPGKIIFSHKVLGKELTDEDKVTLIQSNLPGGEAMWSSLGEDEQAELIEIEAWESEKCTEWLGGGDSSGAAKRPSTTQSKREIRQRKKTKDARFVMDE